jgi:hypothetical protein
MNRSASIPLTASTVRARLLYVLAAVVLDLASCEEVRDTMLSLRQRLRGRRMSDKLHWNHLARGQREQAVKQVAALACLHVVTIGSPVPQRRQERHGQPA